MIFIQRINKLVNSQKGLIIGLSFTWLSLVAVLATLFSKTLNNNYIYQLVLAFLVIYGAGFNFIYDTFYNLFKKRRIYMSGSVFISTQICFFYSIYVIISQNQGYTFSFDRYYFLEAIAIIAFTKSGDAVTNFLNERVNKRAEVVNYAVASQVSVVTDLKTNHTELRPPASVKVADVILVKSNEIVPLDGVCYSDKSIVLDESIVTGETIYLEKHNYDKVFSGTTNKGAAFFVKVDKTFENSTLSNIKKRVAQIKNQKTRLQYLSDRIFNYFVPVLILIAIGTFVLQYFVGYQFNQIAHFIQWNNPNDQNTRLAWAIFTAISVLVVACPCSLGLAIPLAVAIGVAKARSIGASFTDIRTFEKIQKIRVLAVDKTGTLTNGDLVLKGLYGKKSNFHAIYHLEKWNEHPLARAFVNYIETNLMVKCQTSCHSDILSDVKQVPGSGITAHVHNQFWQIISFEKALQQSYKLAPSLAQELKSAEVFKQPLTKIAVVVEGVIENIFSFGDTIRSTAFATIQWFAQKNIEVVMITGDAWKPAKYIAQQLNITHYHALANPFEKEVFISHLQKRYGNKVAYVGDGFNDLIALQKADLSIALGEGNAKIVHQADILLNNSNILTVAKAYKLTQLTRRLIIFNLSWAFFYNIVSVPLALFGLLSPILSVLFMALSSIFLLVIASLFIAKKITISCCPDERYCKNNDIN